MSWIDQYRNKLVTVREAVSCVESGMRVYIHPGCAEPAGLVEALMERAPVLTDVEIVHLLTLGPSPYCAPAMAGHFRHNALFVGGNVRDAVHDGRADYTPIFLGEVEALFESGEMPIDVAFIQVSPPDPHGYCSFGVGVDTTLTAARCARIVVAQVNAQMPRTYGDSFIHVSKLDSIVEISCPLWELKPHGNSEVNRAIGSHVASLIDDGVCPTIRDRRHPRRGPAQSRGPQGPRDPYRVDFRQCHPADRGRRHQRPAQEFQAAQDHPRLPAGHRRSYSTSCTKTRSSSSIPLPIPTTRSSSPPNDSMVAINSAIEVDLTGQVCSDSVGPHFYSGFGGQVDFIRGAARSKGGKPIIALPSTAKNDTVSRIMPMLAPGAGVVTRRADVHYVVTEYGVAYLHGSTIRQRAESLINIAHPKFRDELREYCERTLAEKQSLAQ